jgi:hypothetical protein
VVEEIAAAGFDARCQRIHAELHHHGVRGPGGCDPLAQDAGDARRRRSQRLLRCGRRSQPSPRRRVRDGRLFLGLVDARERRRVGALTRCRSS